MGFEPNMSGTARFIRHTGRQALMLVAAGLMLASPAIWAHAHLTGTQPEDGAILEQAPERLVLEFDSPIRITQFDVTGPEGVVALNDDPLGPLAEEHVAVPADTLTAGEYEILWRGIAEDGHTMAGGYRFTIDE